MALGPIVELQQADRFAAVAQGDQGHGFVPLAVATVAGAALAVRLAGAGQEFGGAVGPETSLGGEEGQGRVEPPAEDVAAHALQDRIATRVPHHLAIGVSQAKPVFQLDELGGEAAGLEIGKIVALPQAHAHRLAAGPLLEETGQAANQFVGVVGVVEQPQQLQGCFPLVVVRATSAVMFSATSINPCTLCCSSKTGEALSRTRHRLPSSRATGNSASTTAPLGHGPDAWTLRADRLPARQGVKTLPAGQFVPALPSYPTIFSLIVTMLYSASISTIPRLVASTQGAKAFFA